MSTTITLWRPERGVTCTQGLGEHRDTIYHSKAACIEGMHRDVLLVMADKPGAFTNHLSPGFCGRYLNHHRKDLPRPGAPPNDERGGRWLVESRPVNPVVAVTKDYVDVTYTYEARFIWIWSERVAGLIDGVHAEAWKEHRIEDAGGWQPYVASYSKNGEPTRSGKRLKPEPFTVRVDDPASIAALLLAGGDQ